MKRWIYRLKVWMIHKLGGYTVDEATPNRKIVPLAMTHRYTTDMLRLSTAEVHLIEHEKAKKCFVESLTPYVRLEERRDFKNYEWVLRLSLRVVDQDLL